eukprot:TRINITY_DN14671_c0_g1_i1.p1 TRINITY_DN14671_c0_g1~~TRINITY_DN14671_c0_g1_i1.p1  ORF type:complete len:366 (+),score=98.20 TRINITY_DN14671_c0_g1_i1:68-1099(+)
MAEEEEVDAPPKFGTYVGRSTDVSCPGDNVNWMIDILEGGASSVECAPELSFFQGGQPPWKAKGTWEMDDGDVIFICTEPDTVGPKKNADITLRVTEEGALLYKGAKCVWSKPPPSSEKEMDLEQMTSRELKAHAESMGLVTDGAVERADLLRLIARAEASGWVKPKTVSHAASSPAPSNSSASPAAAKAPGGGYAAGAQPKAAPKAAATETPSASPSASPKAESSAKTNESVAGSDPPSSAPSPAASSPAAAASPSAASEEKVAAAAAKSEEEAAPSQGGNFYSLEQLTDKRQWEKLDIVSTERETYLADDVFKGLFGVDKEAFAKQPKWKKENQKKKHGLF